MIKAIIFDYDGVIVDSFLNVYKIYNIMCAQLKKPFNYTVEEFRKVYGYHSKECYANLGINTPEEQEIANEIYRTEIIKHIPKLFPHITQVLEKLHKKYKLILLSAAYDKEVKHKLEMYNLAEYFDTIIANDTNERVMKKSIAIKNLLTKYSSEEMIFIGDRIVDYDNAKKTGLQNIIIVEYGWGYDHAKIPEQRIVVEKPLDLLDAIEYIEKH